MMRINDTALSFTGAADGLAIELVSTRAGLDALEADWKDLFARAGHSSQVFQDFNWNWHWANHFLDLDPRSCQLAIVTGRAGGRLAMVWPLVIERVHGLRIAAWMGEPVAQYGDVLVEQSPAPMALLRAGWQFLCTHVKPDLARLAKTRADAAVAPLLTELRAISTNPQDAPYLNLASAPTYAAYEERYSSKARKNRRRQLRRLEEDGVVSVRHLEASAAAGDAVGDVIAMKRAWLQAKGLTSVGLSDRRVLGFFRSVASDGLRPAGFRMSTLMCGDVLAAASVGFVCRDRIAVHMIAYDLNFEKAGAGALLFERAIAANLEDKLAVFDLLAPANSYKMEWADGSVGVDDFAVPLSLAGRAYTRSYLQFLRPKLKTAFQALPLSTRRRAGTMFAMARANLSRSR